MAVMRLGRAMTYLSRVGGYLAASLMAIPATVVLALEGVAQESGTTVPPRDRDSAQTQEMVLPFTDVSPDHWAYQALLNLAGTYGCVSGYPDGSYRGEAAVTRYEFAAGLGACLGAVLGLLEQQSNQQQEVDALIESMEQSLEELRQIQQDVQQLEGE
jgi:hypothetical protein